MTPGTRYNVTLTCDGFTIHDSKRFGTFYKFQFHDDTGTRYEVLAPLPRWKRDTRYSGRATCKKIETRFGHYIVLRNCDLKIDNVKTLL